MAAAEFPVGIGVDAYFGAIGELHRKVFESQREVLTQVAAKMAETILGGGRIFVFGTGHSHMLAEEGYCRAGGLMSVQPIFYTALMLHESIPLEAKVERTPGLAIDLLDRSGIRSGEMLFVYSNSGVNQCPVEMAVEAKKRGVTVVSMSSVAFSKIAPLSGIGKKLWEVSDFAIDNCGVAGDGIIAVPGLDVKSGPTSTVIGAMLWNSLVVETTFRLQAAKGNAPVCLSLNMPGSKEYSEKMKASKEFKLAQDHF
jgi:uncharacterized phosphosugar-binding protein